MKACIFDTETNGLIENHTVKLDKQPEIIEFYGAHVDLAKGKVLKELDLLIKPKGKITDEITKITGINSELVEKAPAFSNVANHIELFMVGCPLVIAHNLSFDVEMIELEMERCHRKIAWPRQLCTVEQTIHLKGFRLSLMALHEHLFGERFESAHRAKPDVQALIRCCIELFKRDLI